MKRRVRIYKAGGQSNAPTQEQIYKHIADRMSAEDYDGDADAILQELTQVGIDPQTADDYITEVSDYLEQNNSGQSAEQEQLSAEEAQAQAEEEQATLEAQNAAEEEARKAQLYAMYNTDTEETTQDDNADEEIIMRQGGSKPSKRSFINQYTKYAKMAQGGDTPSPGADDVLGGREQHVSNFFKGIGESVNSAQQKQAAEEQYNAIYGNPQVGAYAQDGGVHQEEIDPENPLHHLSTYGADTRHIFSDNMYTQNDVAASEQYGGNTDSDSGLYKFIGGGDNESADEQYQDSDLDYQRYAKRGGSLYKYQGTGNSIVDVNKNGISDFVERPEDQKVADTEDYKKKYDELVTQNTTAAQKQQQMMQQYMMQQYMQQMGNQGMFRSPIISRGEQYNKAINSPYYTQSGEKYTGPDLANRLATSVNVTKTNVFGRPKRYTVNYGATPKISSFKVPTYTPGQDNTEMGQSEDVPYRGNTFGERIGEGMMNTRIPGIKQLGQIISRYTTSPEEDGFNTNVPYAPEEEARMKKRDPGFRSFESSENSPSVTNNGPINNNPPFTEDQQRRLTEALRLPEKSLPEMPSVYNGTIPLNTAGPTNMDFNYFENESNAPMNNPNSNQVEQADENKRRYEDYLLRNKAYGGPVDYTQYAYGGDVSIPELYRAQTGFETNADGCPWGSAKDYNGNCVDGQGNVTKKANTDFKFSEPEKLLKKPFSQPYKNPLTDETPAVRMGSDGNYVNEGIKYGDQEGVSQDFRNKQAWDIDKAGVGDLSLLVGNAFANTADEVRANRQENQMLANTTSAETNFGINNAYDQGDYDPNSGLFRPNKMGFNGVSKYGGGVYAMGGDTEDDDEDTQYMTQEEIDDFIANGGELEYL